MPRVESGGCKVKVQVRSERSEFGSRRVHQNVVLQTKEGDIFSTSLLPQYIESESGCVCVWVFLTKGRKAGQHTSKAS